MDLILALLLGFVLGLLVGVRGRRVIATTVTAQLQPTVTAATVDAGQRACVVCGLPANPVRFHDGRYLCATHKVLL